MFQVPEAAGDPLTRWAAILSLIFALMSLTYGIVYIVQFGTMRSMYKASRWAEVRFPVISILSCANITIGSTEDQDFYLVEYMGAPGRPCRLARVVDDCLLHCYHVLRVAYWLLDRSDGRATSSANGRSGNWRSGACDGRICSGGVELRFVHEDVRIVRGNGKWEEGSMEIKVQRVP